MNIKKVILTKISNIIEIKPFEADKIDVKLDKIAVLIANSPAIIHFYPGFNEQLNINFAKKLRQLSSMFNSYFIVVNRLDIAKITDTDGVLFNSNGYNFEYFKTFFHEDKFLAFDFRNSKFNVDKKYFDYIINSNTAEILNIIEL